MKKLKVVISTVLAASALIAGFSAVGCKKHKHKYAKEWSASETEHWHAATCEHTGVDSKRGPHKYDSNFKCTTCDYQLEFAGIGMEKEVSVYTIAEGQTGVKMSTSDIKVYHLSKGGIEGKSIPNSEYDVSVYDGTKKVTNLASVGGGIYNVWAKAKDTTLGETFTLVYVDDIIKSLAFKSGNTEQNSATKDKMSNTWVFEATYTSGAKKEIMASEVKVEGVDSKTVTESAEATVTYTDVSASGVETPKTVKVPYKIKPAPAVYDDVKIGSDELEESNLTESNGRLAIGDTGVTILPDTSGNKLVIDANSKSWTDLEHPENDRSFSKRIKTGGKGTKTSRSIELDVAKKATIVVYAMSGSGSEDRTLCLYGSDFVDTATSTHIGEKGACAAGVLVRLEWQVTEGDIYYLAGDVNGMSIYGIEIIYDKG